MKADFLQGILTPADADALMEAGPIALRGKWSSVAATSAASASRFDVSAGY